MAFDVYFQNACSKHLFTWQRPLSQTLLTNVTDSSFKWTHQGGTLLPAGVPATDLSRSPLLSLFITYNNVPQSKVKFVAFGLVPSTSEIQNTKTVSVLLYLIMMDTLINFPPSAPNWLLPFEKRWYRNIFNDCCFDTV